MASDSALYAKKHHEQPRFWPWYCFIDCSIIIIIRDGPENSRHKGIVTLNTVE